MSNPTKKNYSSSYTRHLKYLKCLSKLHHHYTSPTGHILAPPELLTQIHAQISILADHRTSTLLDPKLWSILYLTKIIKTLGCAHDTEAAKDGCEFKDLHELVWKRVEGLKGMKFREDMSSGVSEEGEGKKRRVTKEVRRVKKGEISSSSSSSEEGKEGKKRRVKLVVRKNKAQDESDEESAFEHGYEPMGKTCLEEENSRVDVERSKKGIPKSKWSRRTILGRRV
ncbi:MAG: hypothetical protein Q9215_004625 [Flavoplaca cf. flavocitrina]